MTSIKPPGGKPPLSGPERSGSSERPAPGGPSFADALDAARESAPAHQPGSVTGAEQAAAAGAAHPVDSIAELARAVDAGQIAGDEALEKLLEQTVAGLGDHLGPAQRSELMAVLRAALAGDPGLAELSAQVAGKRG